MNNLKGHIILATIFIFLAVNASISFGQAKSDVYDEIGIVKGQVRILNNPELGDTPASVMYLVFQRVGCKRCLVATYADLDGNYKLFLGKGKYELIVFEPSPPVYDLLAPDQPRFVQVVPGTIDTIFNIRLTLKNKP